MVLPFRRCLVLIHTPESVGIIDDSEQCADSILRGVCGSVTVSSESRIALFICDLPELFQVMKLMAGDLDPDPVHRQRPVFGMGQGDRTIGG